jgi:TRAP-type C4-dicarboxylate transport system permease small subunit
MKPAELSISARTQTAAFGPSSKDRPAGARAMRLPSVKTVLSILGGLLLIAMMSLTVVDVLGRYIFNAPLKGAGELTEVLLCATIFMGLPAVALRDEHVTVDLITDHLPGWVQPWRRTAIGFLSAGVLAVVTWRLWVYAGQIGSYGGSTSTLRLPIAPLGYFCALCTAVGAVLCIAVPLIRLIRSRKG